MSTPASLRPELTSETLTEFLLARIAEDEVVANEAGRHHAEPLVEGGEHWRWECSDDEVVKPDPGREFMQCSHEDWSMSLRSVEQYPYRSLGGEGPSIHFSLDSELRPTVAMHIARHDPARVLAECEAKRRIVELHPVYRGPRLLAVDSSGTDFACEFCHATSSIDSASVIEALGWCDTLRLLALPYADHEDFQGEWRV